MKTNIRTALAMIGFGFVIARFGIAVRVMAAAKTGLATGSPTALSSRGRRARNLLWRSAG
jgi:uncharacterized membrane protein YidH (DUF202 family)